MRIGKNDMPKKITVDRPIKMELSVKEAARLLRAIKLVIAIEDLKPPYGVEFTLAKFEMLLVSEIEKFDPIP